MNDDAMRQANRVVPIAGKSDRRPFAPTEARLYPAALVRRGHVRPAGMEDVQPRLVQAGLDLEQPEHRVEQVVVAQVRLAALALQAVALDAQVGQGLLAEPHQHRHMGLRLRRQGVGRGVQVQAVFAEGLAMVGDVQHRGVEAFLVVLEQLDDPGQEVVGVGMVLS